MTYIWCTALVTFAGDKFGENKWNADATCIEVKPNGTGSEVVIDINKNIKNDQFGSTNISGDTSIFIKYMHMCSCNGDLAPLFLIIAAEAMPENEFQVYEIGGLTYERSAGIGYLAVTKTRAGNDALWKYYFLNIAIPAMKKSQEVYKNKVRY